MTSATDTFDFPQEWFQTLKWCLVSELALEYAVDKELLSYFDQKAAGLLSESFNDSVEDTSVFFTYRDN
jgi:hypothetical protein